MSLAELADLALLPTSQRSPQPQPARPLDGLWTSRSPVLLPPSPIPGQHSIPVPSPPSLPLFPRYLFGLCASKSGDVYFYGGHTEGRADELYHFSTKDDTATPLQYWGDRPGARHGHVMTLVGDVVALHGGGDGTYANPSLYLLNLVSREWSMVLAQGDAPGIREWHSMVTVDTTIYMFGGRTPVPGSPNADRLLNELWAFDLNTLRTQPRWELVAASSQEQPPPRCNATVVSYQNQLIIFGGNKDKDQFLNDVWSFDVENRRWSELVCTGDIPPPRFGHAAAVLDDVLYITGGRHDILIDVFALKIPDRRWSRLKNTPTTPAGRDAHAATQIGTAIFIFGGRFGSKQSEKESIHVLDANCINNPDLHTPRRLKELELEYQDILTQMKLGGKESELKNETRVQQAEAEEMKSGRQSSVKRVKDLCLELMNEQVNEKTMALVKELSVEVGDVLAENLKLESEIQKSFRRGQIISSILESPFKIDSLAHLQGTNAQILVDFLAEVLERQDILESPADGRRILHLLSKLAKSAHVFPRRAELVNVQCHLTNPVNDEGGYGLIYKGSFRQQAVCVKAVRVLEYGTTADKVLRAQVGELVLLTHATHPNVIPLYGAYLSSEAMPRICIVSPWMENGNLASYLKRHPNMPKIPLMSDVAIGLEFLHDMGIIHADLKAYNILVSRSQRAMLADFGISTVLSTNVGTTTAKDFAGTVFWMAPEQLVPDDAEELSPPTRQSDMWGFACICYEVLTGEIPFAQYYRPQQLIAAFMKGHATPIQPKRSGKPVIVDGGPLVELAEKCWNYDSIQRPTAAEAVRFLADLNVQDDRPSMNQELAMFGSVKSSRTEVEIDYARVLSIIRQK